MARPLGHKRWPAFTEAVRRLGFNRQIVETDRGWQDYMGAELFALFLDGCGSNERRLAAWARRTTEARRGWAAEGRCQGCGGVRDGERRNCESCLRSKRERNRKSRNRRRGPPC